MCDYDVSLAAVFRRLQQTIISNGFQTVTQFLFIFYCAIHDSADLHWCAKIKDEVEKLAYQLNEEAERTERPIRRLRKVMYGSTCADMQLNLTELLPQREMANNQSVRRHLDAFTRGRIIGKLEEGRSVASVAAEFGIAHSIVSRLSIQFQTTGTAIRGFSSGGPRGTTPTDDRYIALQARRNMRQTSGEIARHTTRRLDDRYRVLPWPEDCTVAVCLHDTLYDESRFSLSSDSHRILIWRERGSRNHPSNIIERDRYGGRGVLRRYGSAVPSHGQQCTMSSHSSCLTALRERFAALTLTPVTIRELRLALQDEWAAMPQQLIRLTPSFSAWADAVKPA
ncbi:transposable element Tcb2 transposase [Trichonephila clavipes]|nr:transposable element Tcb2 transposase [Trichonephila clavipes]